MILSGPAITRLILESRSMPQEQADACRALSTPVNPFLLVDPFIVEHVGPNSLDVTLSDKLLVYAQMPLDLRKENPTYEIEIPSSGLELRPGTLYLGATNERIESHGIVPWLDGRSSLGRLGMSLHVTAGRADDGWNGNLTCEITVIHPTIVYPNMRVGQLTFFTLSGRRKPYAGKYLNDTSPTASRMFWDKP